jgi:hypothetical protein
MRTLEALKMLEEPRSIPKNAPSTLSTCGKHFKNGVIVQEDRSERILEIRCDGAEANKLLLFASKVYPEAVQYRKSYHGCAEVGLATHCCYR